MEDLKQQIEEIINKKIRPRTRVDGGDVLLEKIEGDTVYIGAYADCSLCPCCEPELTWWIGKQLKKELNVELNIKIIRHKPYFA